MWAMPQVPWYKCRGTQNVETPDVAQALCSPVNRHVERIIMFSIVQSNMFLRRERGEKA